MGTLGSLRTEIFARQIQRYGEVPTFWLQRVGPCPVAHDDAFTGFTPSNTCAVCGGTGTAYRLMTLPSGVTGGRVLTAAMNARRAQEHGLDVQVGDVQVGFIESEFPFGEGDRLALPSRQLDASELKVRGIGASDLLFSVPALSVLAVFTPSGVLTPTAYSLTTDGKQIQFSGGSAPVAGTQYTVRYRWRPSYIFVEGSFERLPQATNGDYFPTFAQIRLFQQNPMDRKTGDP